jgi:hypothetical protein
MLVMFKLCLHQDPKICLNSHSHPKNKPMCIILIFCKKYQNSEAKFGFPPKVSLCLTFTMSSDKFFLSNVTDQLEKRHCRWEAKYFLRHPRYEAQGPHLIRVNLLNYLKMRSQIKRRRESHTLWLPRKPYSLTQTHSWAHSQAGRHDECTLRFYYCIDHAKEDSI